VDKSKYLKRINYAGHIDATDEVLAMLHKQHLYHVPFENLDIHYKRLFDLDLERIYQKVVNDVRGGFCYELNLLFNWLLVEIGFKSRIIAARIFTEDGMPGPELDHMSVYVKTEKEFLADVGYGDLFFTPLEIKTPVQWDGKNYFRIDRWNEGEYLLSMSPDEKEFSKRYTFSLDLVDAGDFDPICIDKQTNPSSYFVKNLTCTKPTEAGRTTIFNGKLIEKNGDLRIETLIGGEEDLQRVLKEKFGIVIR
jgi:N-hydroxyarylamine O-acetyltransferase